MLKIGIIDGNYGNIRSVFQAFTYLGVQPEIVATPDHLHAFDSLILPGVGTFQNCITSLQKNCWDEALKDFSSTGKHLLGICVGMQVLMEKGYEYGEHYGLGFIQGECHSITSYRDSDQSMPHIGWAEVTFHNGIPERDFLYFNHSYVCAPTDTACIQATATHKKQWPVVIRKDNITGIQCHPEKSHRAGLRFLKHYLGEIS